MRQSLFIVTTVAMCVSCAAQEVDEKKLFAQSDSAIQERIKNVVDVLELNHADPGGKIAALREAQLLMESASDHEEIVKQVAIFAATPTDEEGRPLMAAAALYVLDLPPKIVIRVLAPYLDAENKNLRSFARNWFRSHDKGGSGSSRLDPVNYEDYLDYVRGCLKTNQEIPAGFIEYLYERSPDRALIVFYRAARLGESITKLMEMRQEFDAEQREREKNGKNAEMHESLKRLRAEMREIKKADLRELEKNEQDTWTLPPMPKPQPVPDEILRRLEKKPPKEILLAEHIISNAIWLNKKGFDEEFSKALPAAKQQLSKLAEMDQWWVRLYVAEIMRRHREFRLADVLEKLSNDDNPLVSKSAKSVNK